MAVTQTDKPAEPPAVAGPVRLPEAGDWRTTRYSDVCGGTDEFKRLLVEEPAAAATPEGRAALRSLVDDGMYMLARMEVRLREYQAFRDTLEQLAQEMCRLDEPRLADARREAAQLHRALAQTDPVSAKEAIDRAEEIRQVANDMEGALRRHKEAVIAAGRAYLSLKGPRDWNDGSAAASATGAGAAASAGTTDVAGAGTAVAGATGVGPDANGRSAAGRDGQDGQADSLPPWVPEAWLPPTPHRERIVDWLRKGRAALLSEAEAARLPIGPQGREPWVQFEDGGVMPLRVVRWSEEIRNFYPLGQDPHPRGLLYRKRDAGLPLPGQG